MTSVWALMALVAGAPSDYMGGTFCAAHGPIADSGVFRLANADNMCWRNAANDGNRCVYVNGSDRLMVPSYTKDQHQMINVSARGATAPAEVTIGNLRCLQFNQAQTAETAHLAWVIAGEWDGASDMELHLHVYPESGDAVADGEVIEFDVAYNIIALGAAYDKANTTISNTHTQSGAGTDKALMCIDSIIDYDDATNPVVANSVIAVTIDLDEVTTTYSGNPILCNAHTQFTANTIEGRVE